MILFLAITTVINIGLGYALAMYLGHAKVRGEAMAEASEAPMTLPTRTLASPGLPAATPGTASPPMPAAGLKLSEPLSAATVVDALKDSLDDDVTELPVDHQLTAQPGEASEAGDEPPVEQELLAGIEEFRSQLAQLKGAKGADPAAASRPAAATTAE